MKTNLTAQLAARREAFAAKAQPDWIEIMEAAHRALESSSAADRAPQVGDPAPPFQLPDMSGGFVDLREVLAGGPAILSFFRGRW
jgi:hypothetical protein